MPNAGDISCDFCFRLFRCLGRISANFRPFSIRPVCKIREFWRFSFPVWKFPIFDPKTPILAIFVKIYQITLFRDLHPRPICEVSWIRRNNYFENFRIFDLVILEIGISYSNIFPKMFPRDLFFEISKLGSSIPIYDFSKSNLYQIIFFLKPLFWKYYHRNIVYLVFKKNPMNNILPTRVNPSHQTWDWTSEHFEKMFLHYFFPGIK